MLQEPSLLLSETSITTSRWSKLLIEGAVWNRRVNELPPRKIRAICWRSLLHVATSKLFFLWRTRGRISTKIPLMVTRRPWYLAPLSCRPWLRLGFTAQQRSFSYLSYPTQIQANYYTIWTRVQYRGRVGYTVFVFVFLLPLHLFYSSWHRFRFMLLLSGNFLCFALSQLPDDLWTRKAVSDDWSGSYLQCCKSPESQQ